MTHMMNVPVSRRQITEVSYNAIEHGSYTFSRVTELNAEGIATDGEGSDFVASTV